MARVRVTSLELTDPDSLRPAPPVAGTVVERIARPELNAALYREVGARWAWTDRLAWTDGEWRAWAGRVHTDVLRAGGETAGYYELEPQDGGSVEIAILGLREGFHARGLGGHLLTEAARRAWALPGTRRVWVHTCTLDGPHALANYRARGFTAFAEHDEDR